MTTTVLEKSESAEIALSEAALVQEIGSLSTQIMDVLAVEEGEDLAEELEGLVQDINDRVELLRGLNSRR